MKKAQIAVLGVALAAGVAAYALMPSQPTPQVETAVNAPPPVVENDDVLVAAVTELVGADRFPELDELRKAYEEQEYGDTREVREAVSAEAQHWVSVAEAIVRAAAELIGGSAE